MQAEIIAIGSELLIGHVVNTNASYLSEELNAIGVSTHYHVTVGDNPERITEALELAASRSDLIITTGGLGPTADDITHEVIADYMKLALREDPEQRVIIEQKFKDYGNMQNVPRINFKQARLCENSTVISNPVGTAIGMLLHHQQSDTYIATFPGVPCEMEAMFQTCLRPWLIEKQGNKHGAIISRKIKMTNITESVMAQIIEDNPNTKGENLFESQNPSVAPYAILGECYLRVTAKAESEHKARNLIQAKQMEIEQLFPNKVYGYDDDTISSVLAQALIDKDLKISFAESCTGGLASKMLTDIPGASAYTHFNVVTYANEIKTKVLGVTKETLNKHGAVSEECALEMVEGLAKLSEADVHVSITGIAGPDGGSAEKPVGTIWIGIKLNAKASKSGVAETIVRSLDWKARSLSRDQVRELAVKKTFFRLLELIK